MANEKQQRINEQIRVREVRVVGMDGAQLGILTIEQALSEARAAGADLVEVAPTERPPVCRIMDFGKFKYQQKKKQQKTVTQKIKVKEIRLRPKTGEHDMLVRVNQARDFLLHKDKVLVSIIYKGRELAHMEEGRKVLDEFLSHVTDVGQVEQSPSRQGKRVLCTVAPRNDAKPSVASKAGHDAASKAFAPVPPKPLPNAKKSGATPSVHPATSETPVVESPPVPESAS
ncbi:MAG: translation initiation factor IF-3 [Thermoguttaceae bacterium]|nr:translation initiation factor IF-3 [Thermoguttaceae bacterium]